MNDRITPVRLNLKKDEKLEIDWKDGHHSTYTISLLRSQCPCAACRAVRGGYEGHAPAISTTVRPKTSLTILPGNYSQPLAALSAELVGNYALRIDWSDGHGSGIYSFEFLRDLSPA